MAAETHRSSSLLRSKTQTQKMPDRDFGACGSFESRDGLVGLGGGGGGLAARIGVAHGQVPGEIAPPPPKKWRRTVVMEPLPSLRGNANPLERTKPSTPPTPLWDVVPIYR